MEIAWLAGAFAMGLIVDRAGLPPLVGYLGAGLGLSVAGFEATELLGQAGHLGVLFLLFTVGLHLRLRNLLRAEVLGAGGLHLVIAGGLFAVLVVAVGRSGLSPLALGALLALSSTVLAAKALESRDALGAYQGRIAIGVLVLQDAVAVGLLVSAGMAGLSPWVAALLLLPLVRPLLVRLVGASGEGELLLLYGLLLALGGAAVFSAVGLADELGALVAGALLAGHPRAEALGERLWSLKEAFLVGFFLEIGLVGFPDARGWLVAAGLLLLLAAKAALFFGLFVTFRLRARTAYMTSLSLASYSEFALIVGAVAVERGLLASSTLAALALAVVGSFGVNALLNRYANPLYGRIEPWLVRFERAGRHPDDQPRSLGGARILVVGMGRVGAAAYDALAAKEARPVGLDDDPARIERHRHEGRRVIYGDATDPRLWAELEPGRLSAVIMAIEDFEAEARAAEMLRASGFDGEINALATRREEDERLRQAGVSTICHPLIQAGVELADRSLRPLAA